MSLESSSLKEVINGIDLSQKYGGTIVRSYDELLLRQIEQVLILQAQQQQNYEQQENVNQQILNFINSSNIGLSILKDTNGCNYNTVPNNFQFSIASTTSNILYQIVKLVSVDIIVLYNE